MQAGKRAMRTGYGTRKYGRNLVKCGKYKAKGIREKNKAKKIAKDAKMKAKNKEAQNG